MSNAVESAQNFAIALNRFMEVAQSKVNERMREYDRQSIRLEKMVGSRYTRIVAVDLYNGKETGSRSAWCFVDNQTGAVLKTAGWKAPAKGVRSYIYAADSGASGITGYGAVYNR